MSTESLGLSPESLRLKGFTGIQRGLGKSEITFDFTKYREFQLIAIVGKNGRGKTTFLRNAHPYLTMPSSDSDGGDFSFYDHLSEEGGEKEFIFTLNGLRYRQLCSFKVNGKNRKTEAYLFVFIDGNWTPYCGAGGVSSDGKVSTYKALIEALCGPPSLYFTAIHQAQGRRALHTLSNAEVKDLMASMFGADSIKKSGEQAKKTASAIAQSLEPARARLLSSLETINNELPKLRQRQKELSVQETALLVDKDTTVRAGNEARTAVANAQAAVSQQGALIERLRVVESDIASVSSSFASKVGAQTVALKSVDSELATQVTTIEKEQRTDRGTANEAEVAIRRHSDLLTRADAIQVAVTRLGVLPEEIAVAEVAQAKAREDLAAEHAREALLSSFEKQLEGHAKAGTEQADALQRLQKQAETMAVVPCRGTEMQSRCDLLAIARKASEEVPAGEKKLSDMRALFKSTRAEREKVLLGGIQVAARKLQVDSAVTAVKLLNEEKVRVAGVAAQGVHLKTAEIEVTRLTLQRTDALARIDARAAQRAGAEQAALIKKSTLFDLHQSERAACDAQLLRLNAERQELRANDAASQVISTEKALANCNASVERIVGTLRGVTEELIATRMRLERHESDYVQADCELSSLSSVAHAQSDYLLLSKAFGNDGIIALLIDEAGPALTSIANDLLAACYGFRFSIEIKTQITSQATGAVREGFQLIVHDAEAGAGDPIERKSGGERVWINECVVRAIAIYLAKQSGYHFDTCFSDETDGPLDDQRKRQFVEMKRKGLELSGHKQEFFISHSAEICELADAVINFDDYQQDVA